MRAFQDDPSSQLTRPGIPGEGRKADGASIEAMDLSTLKESDCQGREAQMPALLIARFRGDVEELTRAYDRAHKVIMEAGGPPGELRHHCAVGDDSLFLVGVWESEELLRARFASVGFQRILAEAGFPSMADADITILRLHAIEPPL